MVALRKGSWSYWVCYLDFRLNRALDFIKGNSMIKFLKRGVLLCAWQYSVCTTHLRDCWVSNLFLFLVYFPTSNLLVVVSSVTIYITKQNVFFFLILSTAFFYESKQNMAYNINPLKKLIHFLCNMIKVAFETNPHILGFEKWAS